MCVAEAVGLEADPGERESDIWSFVPTVKLEPGLQEGEESVQLDMREEVQDVGLELGPEKGQNELRAEEEMVSESGAVESAPLPSSLYSRTRMGLERQAQRYKKLQVVCAPASNEGGSVAMPCSSSPAESTSLGKGCYLLSHVHVLSYYKVCSFSIKNLNYQPFVLLGLGMLRTSATYDTWLQNS